MYLIIEIMIMILYDIRDEDADRHLHLLQEYDDLNRLLTG